MVPCCAGVLEYHVLGRPSPIKQCLQVQAEFGPENCPSGSPSLLLIKLGKSKPNQEIGIPGVVSGKNIASGYAIHLLERTCPS